MTAERCFLWRLGLLYDQIDEIKKDSFKRGKDQEPESHKRHLAGAVHEAVVPDLHEPFWQHMLKEAAEKFMGTEGGFSGSIAS